MSIDAGPLSGSLRNLARQSGIDLLFDSNLVRGLQAPAIGGKLSTEDALRQLLAQTDLTVRRAESGAWIIERPEPPPLAQQDAGVSEILVIGRRTQNADIRRVENDVQPYVVATKKEILESHRDDIDQYFQSRVTSNTVTVPLGLSRNADTRSQFDIRGLGVDSTVVLVDGRRMPGFPTPLFGFAQSDLNAIPLHSVERIEVLTGAAGGIYGFGALGGVINVILDRNSDGADLHITEGISSRGDAHRQAVEARFSYTSDDGSTDFAASAAHSESDPLLARQRDYEIRDRMQTFANDPEFYLRALNPPGNSVGVFSDSGGSLVFKPEFGGANLGSSRTFLPAGFSGNAAALTSSLREHVGELDFSLSEGDGNQDLGSRPQSDAFLVNLRQRFEAGLEVYADALVLRSRGESFKNERLYGQGFLTPESPANPFTETIQVVFPVSGLSDSIAKRLDSSRYTTGLVADLPLDWRGTLEAAWGEFRYVETEVSEFPGSAAFPFLTGDPSDPDTNPFGDWDAFQSAVSVDSGSISVLSPIHNRFRQHSLRLAGPVFETPEGPATLTLLAERTSEDMPASVGIATFHFGGEPTTNLNVVAPYSSTTTSFYAELRAPLFGHDAPSLLLRGLEVQLAMRSDRREEDFARALTFDDTVRQSSDFSGTSYTAGLKFTPAPWLMLRGSYATGKQPPPFTSLRALEQVWDVPLTTDPRRGDTDLGLDGEYEYRFSGNTNLKTVDASTAFLGAVLSLSGEDGPTLAIDLSRISKTRDVMFLSAVDVLAHEDFWPERVERAPLTDADRALGYTGGRIITIDARAMNGGRQEVDAIDVRAEWPLEVLGGRLRLYADATHHMRNVLEPLFRSDERRAGFKDGPLKWRANGGFDWSMDRLSIGANVQYFGSYLAVVDGLTPGAEELVLRLQGSREIPEQFYLDLHASWRIPVPDNGAVRDLTLDFGVVNVLDEAPPRENAFIFRGPGYSRYGDPRQRRFEATLSSHF